MKKAVRKGASKAVALVLSLAMILGMAPMVSASAGSTADAQDNFDRIVHLDMGRKYYSPEWIKALIQEISALGYTELELDFSNNEGFRFSLSAEQMQIEVGGYETVLVEVEPEEGAQDAEEPVTAVPLAGGETAEPAPTSTAQPEPEEGESEPAVTDEPESTPQYKEVEVFQSKTVDLSQALSRDGYITAEQMADIIDCADEAGIEIVPLLNSPGHMGAILNVFPEYRWTDNLNRTSESTIDLENDEAVRFAQGVVGAYAQWFSEHGCETFNIGADEFANDIGGTAGAVMGLNYIYNSEKDVYSKLIEYINDLAVIVQGYGMTPRAFNDSFCYKNDTAYAPSTDIQVCYWSSGWGGYSVASASTLEKKGYQLINTHGDYYYVLGKNDCWDYGNARYDFDNNVFPGSTISNPVGSMFCIWSDYPNAETEQKVAEKVRVPLRIMAARMQDQKVSAGTVDTSVIPGGFNADGTINTDVPVARVRDEATGITVAAPGLTDIKVNTATVAALQGDYVAYDMTPVAGAKNYTAEAKVSIPLGKMVNYEAGKLTGFVVESDGKITEIPGEVSGDNYVFTMPHFSVGGVMLRSDSATEPREITVTVGQTETDTITGANYAGNSYTTDHPEIATVTVTGQDGSEESITYERVSVACAELLNSDFSSWRNTGYYCEIGGQYYQLYAQRKWEWRFIYTWGYSRTGSVQDVEPFGQQADVAIPGMAGPNIAIYTQKKGPGTEAYTDVTFHGHRAGTTYVEIGNVGYTINVLSEDLTAVTPKKLEYFITNSRVYENERTSSPSSMEIKAISDGVATEEGVALSGVAPANGYSNYDGWQALEYWKTSLLPNNNRQEAVTGDDTDKSLDGETVLRIRYWESKWQYQNTEENWVDIKDNDQLVAYYMKKTTVTPQIDTYGKDWGYDVNPDNGKNGYSGNAGQVALSFAVVYPGGTISPATNEVYKQTTTVFNYWNNRDFGIVMVRENDIHEASKIALVKGERQVKHYQTNGYSTEAWYGDENITWDTRYNFDTGKEELNTSNVVWTKESGTEPVIQGSKVEGGTWTERDTAILVLIYLDVKTSEDNLKVRYIDDSASGKVAFEYDVAVRNTAGQDPITFVNGIKNSGEMHIGQITLSDNAYIEDATGQPQSFNKNIATVPALAGTQYATGQYNYVRAVISNEGKTLELHYQKTAAKYQFVLDYGLPIVITAEDLGITNADGITFQTSATASYGSLSCDNTKHTITYTPTKFLDGIDTFKLEINYKNGEPQREAIDIIPASTVYYEDTEPFVTYSEGWTSLGEVSSRTQTTSKLGSGDIYGYDTAYAKDTTYSGGSAHKVTLGSGETATASFTFHGTGFQFVSMTDATSGCITVHVNGNGVDRYYFVDCYYQNVGALNQVPVMKVENLDLGTYTVTVTAGHLGSFDWNEDGKSTFVLDGIRIYKPVGDYENYKQDNEGSAVYSEIRNILIGDWKDSNSVYVDTLNESTKDFNKYLKVGPNNEVYLKNGDKITFTVPEGGSIVQIGAKLVSGSKMTFTVDQKQYEITSAAEMYYLLNGVQPDSAITITATEGKGILSLTNLKLVSGS